MKQRLLFKGCAYGFVHVAQNEYICIIQKEFIKTDKNTPRYIELLLYFITIAIVADWH